MNILIIGGVFDDQGGRPSGYIRRMGEAFQKKEHSTTIINGGYYYDLCAHLNGVVQYDWVYWMGDIPNDKEKLVNRIHLHYPNIKLFISKNNRKNIYTPSDLHTRITMAQANGLLEFTQMSDVIQARIMQPDGQYYSSHCIDIAQLVDHLMAYQKKL